MTDIIIPRKSIFESFHSVHENWISSEGVNDQEPQEPRFSMAKISEFPGKVGPADDYLLTAIVFIIIIIFLFVFKCFALNLTVIYQRSLCRMLRTDTFNPMLRIKSSQASGKAVTGFFR